MTVEPAAAAEAQPGSDAAGIDPAARAALAAVADQLIPAAHGMPSAAEVLTDDRLAFVLRSRPDLVDPLRAALRPELGADPAARLGSLAQDEPGILSALQLVIVAGYYTDRHVRELVGYRGQEAIEVRSWVYPAYLEEGLIDAVMARGPVWRDPETGVRARDNGQPRSFAERAWGAEPSPDATANSKPESTPAPQTPEGGSDGRDDPA